MTDEHAILQEMDQAMNELADLAGSHDLTPDQAVQMNQKILSILLPEQTLAGESVNTEGQIETLVDRQRQKDRFYLWTDNGRRTDDVGRTDFD